MESKSMKSLHPARGRVMPDLPLPFISCEGTAYECGAMLGGAWKETIQLGAERASDAGPWWKNRRYIPLIAKYAPHLPDLYRGMAEGAGVPEDAISTRAPKECGCTSFAIAPEMTLDGIPISGQTKDTPMKRGFQLQVIRLKMSDAPSALSLTYPGWLFGHGFVRGGTAIWRNSIYVEGNDSGLPYAVWGILALHCKSVGEVIELTRRYGVREAFHVTVSDERGGIVGIENGKGGPVFLRPRRGIYTHANCIISNRRLLRLEKPDVPFDRSDSLHRTARLRELLEADRGRLTAQLAYRALSDHEGYPISICRHEGLQAMTCTAVVVEPTRGLLHATRGNPCCSWPRTYAL